MGRSAHVDLFKSSFALNLGHVRGSELEMQFKLFAPCQTDFFISS